MYDEDCKPKLAISSDSLRYASKLDRVNCETVKLRFMKLWYNPSIIIFSILYIFFGQYIRPWLRKLVASFSCKAIFLPDSEIYVFDIFTKFLTTWLKQNFALTLVAYWTHVS